jgi:hypothetical protein
MNPAISMVCWQAASSIYVVIPINELKAKEDEFILI